MESIKDVFYFRTIALTITFYWRHALWHNHCTLNLHCVQCPLNTEIRLDSYTHGNSRLIVQYLWFARKLTNINSMYLRRIWLCFGIFNSISAQDPVANLPLGRVVGIKVFTENSLVPVEVFFGIPYALPPIGRLRFSPPEKHPGWKRTLFAHRMPPRCPHPNNDGNTFNEDCLYLNIWTPRRVDANLFPVMVILYSESWNKGGITLPCQELAAEGLVVITVAFRLSILAFFTLKTKTARGNLALLDQYLALLWVRENIAAFGGDPNAITLVGHSAGADSVLLHIASPRTKGLFHRAVIMSPTNIWKAIEKDNRQTTKSDNLSKLVLESSGCPNDTPEKSLQCLRSRPVSDILTLYSNNWTDLLAPTPEDFLPESERYLQSSLSTAFSSNGSRNINLEVLIGTTNLAAINLEKYEDFLKGDPKSVLNNAISTIISETLGLLSLDGPENESILSQAIVWEFLGSKTFKESERNSVGMLEDLAQMETSAKWGAGCTLLAAKLSRKVSQLYVYQYLQPNYVDLRGSRLNLTGATNGAELLALLGDALMLQVARRASSQVEKRISLKFRKFISNFAKFGSPDNQRKWPRYLVGDSYIHEICNEDIPNCNQFKTSKQIAFWLQYLPRLANIISLKEHTEKITSNDESQLRGGIFALCGFSVTLLLLLVASVIMLHRKRTIRPLDIDSEITHKKC